jgi:hypothetical protein
MGKFTFENDEEGNLYVLASFMPGKRYKVIRGFESMTGWYWFAFEDDEVQGPDLYFGLVQGFEEELGYFSMTELTPLICKGSVWEIKKRDLPYSGRRS